MQFLGSMMNYFCSKRAGNFEDQVAEMFLDHLKPSMIKDPEKISEASGKSWGIAVPGSLCCADGTSPKGCRQRSGWLAFQQML